MSKLFSGPKAPKVKEPEPVPMPDPESPEVDAARRRQQEAARLRSGRASTILTGDYSRETLG